MTCSIFSRSSLLLAALVLSACGSTVRLGDVPVEDRSGSMANRAGAAGQAGGAGTAAGSGAGPAGAAGSAGSAAGAAAPVTSRVVVPVDLTSRSAPGLTAGAGGGAGAPGGAMSGSGAGAGGGAGAGALAPVPANLQQGNVIRFAFDSFEIPSEYLTLVDAHARFLSANPRRKVMLAGHADEQGGREYNLALGQKRAEAVRQRLTFLGVPDRQIEAVSFGEEKPVATGSSEDAYRQNRRAEISYP